MKCNTLLIFKTFFWSYLFFLQLFQNDLFASLQVLVLHKTSSSFPSSLVQREPLTEETMISDAHQSCSSFLDIMLTVGETDL